MSKLFVFTTLLAVVVCQPPPQADNDGPPGPQPGQTQGDGPEGIPLFLGGSPPPPPAGSPPPFMEPAGPRGRRPQFGLEGLQSPPPMGPPPQEEGSQ